jgi:hypothetical protein
MKLAGVHITASSKANNPNTVPHGPTPNAKAANRLDTPRYARKDRGFDDSRQQCTYHN